jgi:hypothetical protein
MFCAASLPRKWSMRKICDSSNTECRKSLSRTALVRSFPNGFSITTESSRRGPASRSIPMTASAALGGTDR